MFFWTRFDCTSIEGWVFALVGTGRRRRRPRWSIENVAGARKAMEDAVELRGSLFGLKVARPRLFESSFELGLVLQRCLVRSSGVLPREGCRREGRGYLFPPLLLTMLWNL